jgi:hypothetical protein
MYTDERRSKQTVPRRLAAIVDGATHAVGIVGPLLLVAAGLWLVFNLARFLVGIDF